MGLRKHTVKVELFVEARSVTDAAATVEMRLQAAFPEDINVPREERVYIPRAWIRTMHITPPDPK